MRYMVTKNFVQMIGTIWMPATTAAMQKDLTDYEINNILDAAEYQTGERKLTREAIEDWLGTNSGDFQCVDDFYASIGNEEFPWEKGEESELTYHDCMYPSQE
jgi:hypothetical protein